MRIALATTCAALPADAEAVLAGWRKRRPGPTRKRQLGPTGLALATDARLPLGLQAEVVELAGHSGIEIVEIAVPLLDTRGRRQPSPGNGDRAERAAFQALTLESAALAARCGATRVVLLPTPITLHQPVDVLRAAYLASEGETDEGDAKAAGLDVLDFGDLLHELLAERATLADSALDGWRCVLDPLLTRAADLGLEVRLLGPTIWPQQLPSMDEVEMLRGEFAGAPLFAQHATDWAHARRCLRGDETRRSLTEDDLPAEILAGLKAPAIDYVIDTVEASPSAAEAAKLRLADANGLELRLAPGEGEIDFESVLERFETNHDNATATLVVDPHATAADVQRTLVHVASI